MWSRIKYYLRKTNDILFYPLDYLQEKFPFPEDVGTGEWNSIPTKTLYILMIITFIFVLFIQK